MKDILNITQGSPEWHVLRKSKIGASDAPVIMGVSPWKTPYQLWKEKARVEVQESNTSAAMQRGNDLEPLARQYFTHVFGVHVRPAVMLHGEYPWMMASFDGLSRDNKTLVEIKCPGQSDHDFALNGSIPIKYYPQLQHQIEVAQVSQCHYLSFDGKEGVTIIVERDEEYIAALLKKEEAFWNLIQEGVPPELETRDYQERNDPKWLETVKDWKVVKSLLKDYEEREKEIRQRLILLSNGMSCIGGGVKLSKGSRKGNVDYKAIPELMAVDLEQYRKGTIEVWRVDEN